MSITRWRSSWSLAKLVGCHNPGDPAVAEPGDPLERASERSDRALSVEVVGTESGPLRHVAAAGDQDRRMRLLGRPVADANLLEVVDVAIEGDGFLGPEPLQELDRLVERLAAPVLRDADQLVLASDGSRVAGPEANAEQRPAPGDHVKGGPILRQQDRVAHVRLKDAGPDANPMGPGRDRRKHG